MALNWYTTSLVKSFQPTEVIKNISKKFFLGCVAFKTLLKQRAKKYFTISSR